MKINVTTEQQICCSLPVHFFHRVLACITCFYESIPRQFKKFYLHEKFNRLVLTIILVNEYYHLFDYCGSHK